MTTFEIAIAAGFKLATIWLPILTISSTIAYLWVRFFMKID